MGLNGPVLKNTQHSIRCPDGKARQAVCLLTGDFYQAVYQLVVMNYV